MKILEMSREHVPWLLGDSVAHDIGLKRASIVLIRHEVYRSRVARTRRTNLRGSGRGTRMNYEECEWLDQARLKRSAPLVASRRR